MFSKVTLTTLLTELTTAQESIEKVSVWLLQFREEAPEIVLVWKAQYIEGDDDKKLTLLYLANDVLQNSRRKGTQFTDAFGHILPTCLSECKQHALQINRMLDIWESRSIFHNHVISAMRYSRDEFGMENCYVKAQDVVDSLEELRRLENESSDVLTKLSQRLDTTDFANAFNVTSKKEGDKFAADFDETALFLDEYCTCLSRQTDKRMSMLKKINTTMYQNEKFDESTKRALTDTKSKLTQLSITRKVIVERNLMIDEGLVNVGDDSPDEMNIENLTSEEEDVDIETVESKDLTVSSKQRRMCPKSLIGYLIIWRMACIAYQIKFIVMLYERLKLLSFDMEYHQPLKKSSFASNSKFYPNGIFHTDAIVMVVVGNDAPQRQDSRNSTPESASLNPLLRARTSPSTELNNKKQKQIDENIDLGKYGPPLPASAQSYGPPLPQAPIKREASPILDAYGPPIPESVKNVYGPPIPIKDDLKPYGPAIPSYGPPIPENLSKSNRTENTPPPPPPPKSDTYNTYFGQTSHNIENLPVLHAPLISTLVSPSAAFSSFPSFPDNEIDQNNTTNPSNCDPTNPSNTNATTKSNLKPINNNLIPPESQLPAVPTECNTSISRILSVFNFDLPEPGEEDRTSILQTVFGREPKRGPDSSESVKREVNLSPRKERSSQDRHSERHSQDKHSEKTSQDRYSERGRHSDSRDHRYPNHENSQRHATSHHHQEKSLSSDHRNKKEERQNISVTIMNHPIQSKTNEVKLQKDKSEILKLIDRNKNMKEKSNSEIKAPANEPKFGPPLPPNLMQMSPSSQNNLLKLGHPPSGFVPGDHPVFPILQSGPHFHGPNGPPMGFNRPPQMGMYGPNIGPNGPNMGPNGPNMGPSGPNMDPSIHQHGPYIGPNGPNISPSGPNIGRDIGPSGPNGPSMGPRGPNMRSTGPHIGPHSHHVGPNGSHMGSNGPCSSTMGPNGRFNNQNVQQGGPLMGPNGPQNNFNIRMDCNRPPMGFDGGPGFQGGPNNFNGPPNMDFNNGPQMGLQGPRMGPNNGPPNHFNRPPMGQFSPSGNQTCPTGNMGSPGNMGSSNGIRLPMKPPGNNNTGWGRGTRNNDPPRQFGGSNQMMRGQR